MITHIKIIYVLIKHTQVTFTAYFMGLSVVCIYKEIEREKETFFIGVGVLVIFDICMLELQLYEPPLCLLLSLTSTR